MDLLIASMLASAIAPAPSELPAPSALSNQPVETITVESAESTETTTPNTTSQRSEPTVNPNQVTCPPGQFASAFSDVYPTDWAYQAVNNLASTPQQCFDLPNQASGDFPNDWTL
ncbi:MAG: hypothetical protein ACTS2F_28885 [Thainema sp.]